LELEADLAEGRSWFGEPGSAELVDWAPVLDRAGVKVAAHRVAAVYLELAVLVRALEGLAAQARWHSSIDRGSLWAGLFELGENLLGRAVDDLRDRKSTRLNSSHVKISYAVFCLKKKKTKNDDTHPSTGNL